MEDTNTLGYGSKEEFANHVKKLIVALFSGDKIPARIKGSKRQIETFTAALVAECAYLRASMKMGPEHQESVKIFAILDTAIRRFERATGIDWPIR